MLGTRPVPRRHAKANQARDRPSVYHESGEDIYHGTERGGARRETQALGGTAGEQAVVLYCSIDGQREGESEGDDDERKSGAIYIHIYSFIYYFDSDER